MKTLLKIGLWLAGVVVVLITAAVIIVPMVFDPNDHKDRIIALVEEQTGRKLSLAGDIQLSVFPWLGVEVEGVSLGNAPGFGDQPFVKADRVQVRAALLPLLRKKVEMGTVSIHGAAVNLARNKEGKTNWHDLIPAEEEAEVQAPQAEQAEGPPGVALALGGLDVQNANLVWNDQAEGRIYAVEGLNVETDELVMNEPIVLAASFTFDASAERLSGDIALDGTLDYDVAAKRYRLAPFNLTGKFRGEALPGGAVAMKLATGIEADLEAATARFSNLALQAMGTEVSGDLQARQIFDPIPLLDGQLQIAAGGIPELLEALGQDAAAVPLKSVLVQTSIRSTDDTVRVDPLKATATLEGEQMALGPVNVELATSADINVGAQTLAVKSLTVKGMGLDVQSAFKGSQIIDDPKLSGSLKVAPFNLRELLIQLNQEAPETADPEVLKNVALNTQFHGSPKDLRLQKLAIHLDDTRIDGDLSVANFEDPAIAFGVRIDAIDTDRYLPPKPEGEQAPVAAPGAAAEAAAEAPTDVPAGFPVDTLRALKVKGALHIGKLTVAKAKLTNVKLDLNARDGKITLNPASAQLYQGSYQGNIGLDATAERPRLRIESALQGIQVGPLLEDLTGKAKIDGRTNASAMLSAVGSDADAIKKSLTGNAKFEFRDGAVKGVNIAGLIRAVKARLEGTPPSSSDEPEQTDFSELTGTVTIDKGIVHNEDLSAKSPLLRVKGSGTANLATEELDYSLNTTLVGSLKGQGGKDVYDMKGIPIPIRVSGTFDKVKYTPDIRGLAEARAKKELEKQSEKVREKLDKKLKKKLGDELGGALGGLLGGKTKEAPKEAESQPAEPQKAPDPTSDDGLEDQLRDKLKGVLPF